MRASASSGELPAVAPEDLTPLSVHGLWLADTTAAGAPARGRQ